MSLKYNNNYKEMIDLNNLWIISYFLHFATDRPELRPLELTILCILLVIYQTKYIIIITNNFNFYLKNLFNS